MTLAVGSRLGPYEVLSPIGAGGMGEVYKARDTRLGRTVAIKVLPPHLSPNPELRERFDREAKAISALSHPHVCALYDVGHREGTDYLVMEYLEGETLATRAERPVMTAGDAGCSSQSGPGFRPISPPMGQFLLYREFNSETRGDLKFLPWQATGNRGLSSPRPTTKGVASFRRTDGGSPTPGTSPDAKRFM